MKKIETDIEGGKPYGLFTNILKNQRVRIPDYLIKKLAFSEKDVLIVAVEKLEVKK